MPSTIYDFTVYTIDGKEIPLSEYAGKVLLIVNVASKCGFTKQYEGLEKIYQKYKSKGLVICGFPCNQFGGQEPGSSKDIKEFCSLKYNVTFPMFDKINVNGKNAHPLYVFLKSQAKGLLGTESIKWNFTKFLVDKKGNVIKRFASKDTPESLESEIENLID